jgi:hypothetical protein
MSCILISAAASISMCHQEGWAGLCTGMTAHGCLVLLPFPALEAGCKHRRLQVRFSSISNTVNAKATCIAAR